jgi:hypothetical protein
MINLLAYLTQQASLTGLPNLPSQLTHFSSSGAQLSAHQISKVPTNFMTSLLAYLTHQASLAGLPNPPSQVTHLSS